MARKKTEEEGNKKCFTGNGQPKPKTEWCSSTHSSFERESLAATGTHPAAQLPLDTVHNPFTRNLRRTMGMKELSQKERNALNNVCAVLGTAFEGEWAPRSHPVADAACACADRIRTAGSWA